MATDESIPLTVAAIDLGSNSFHMVIGRSTGHDVHILDRLKQPVRLAAGLDKNGNISPEAQKRALDTLQLFGQRLATLPEPRVRVVGTNTLRRAKDSKDFRLLAREALGHTVEVISGQEEARLIYLGVAHSHPPDVPCRLVVDIGGGSTEVIVGRDFEVLDAHSLFIGCVFYSERYFPDGKLTAEAFKDAETAARLELRGIRKGFAKLGWEAAVGASGTINAVDDILRGNEWSQGPITLEALKKLRKAMIKAGQVADLNLTGLAEDRAAVLAGGLAILIAIFRALRIDSMTVSSGALREGVLYDLLGRIRHEDIRERTIQRMAAQYQVDTLHAERVENTALELLDQVAEAWHLDPELGAQFLHWAVYLHEIGLTVSYTGFHRHGAYLVENTNMPGFAKDDQQLLASMIRGHRRKVVRSQFDELPEDRVDVGIYLSMLLRLAVVLNRSRTEQDTPQLEWNDASRTLRVRVPPQWDQEQPLTLEDLEGEVGYAKALGIKLKLCREKSA